MALNLALIAAFSASFLREASIIVVPKAPAFAETTVPAGFTSMLTTITPSSFLLYCGVGKPPCRERPHKL
jgi:hypothetical protein